MSGAVADDFEQPAILKASDVIGDKLLRGEYHVVDDAVRNDGYLNYYVLRSDYGDWEVTGTALLAVRVREVEALATLDEVSKTEVFVKAAADAGVGQLKAVTQFATHPVESVKGIPSGIGRMFKRYKRQAGDAVETTKEFVASDDEDNVEAVVAHHPARRNRSVPGHRNWARTRTRTTRHCRPPSSKSPGPTGWGASA